MSVFLVLFMIKQGETASLPSEIIIHCPKVLGKFGSHLIAQACTSENLVKENKWNEEVGSEAISLHFKVRFFMIDSVAGRIVASGFFHGQWPVYLHLAHPQGFSCRLVTL